MLRFSFARRYLEAARGLHSAVLGKPARDFGLWAGAAERERLVAQLRERRSVAEQHVSYRGRDGVTRRAVVALEFIEVGGRECVLALFWNS